MRCGLLTALAVVALARSAGAADPLAEARRLYNAGQYESAERLAREATQVAGLADPARVVLGRIQLERFRQTANPEDLQAARASLRVVDPRPLGYMEHVELTIGQAEALYLDDRFGAAAELFESSLDRAVVLGAAARERVLDWWATALDRDAQARPAAERAPLYARLAERMRGELAVNPGSAPASYWLAAAARGAGDLERAWQASMAGWVRAALTQDRGAALRADLDRLVTQALVPERAAKLPRGGGADVQRGMQNEWVAFKEGWEK